MKRAPLLLKDGQNDVEKILSEILKREKDCEEDIGGILKRIEGLEGFTPRLIQKVGIIRFNPFKETGSNQSFSLALLDGNDNGVVVTSLYTREGNRVYGKPIKRSQSEYLLTEEEKEAMEFAKKV